MKLFVYLFLLSVFIPSLFTGCSGPYYYDLNLTPDRPTDSQKLDKILWVDDIDISHSFHYRGIAYRKSAYRVQYYAYKNWAKTPEELVKDSILKYYKNSRYFRRVIENDSSAHADIKMKTKIDALEMVFEQKEWFAHLSLDIELIDMKKKEEPVVMTHLFDRKLKLDGKKVRDLPEKISVILKAELVSVLSKIRRYYSDEK